MMVTCEDKAAYAALKLVYREWLECKAKTEPGDIPDQDCNAVDERMRNLFIEAARLSAPHSIAHTIAWKVRMLEFDMHYGTPTDNRHQLMLASIRADLESF